MFTPKAGFFFLEDSTPIDAARERYLWGIKTEPFGSGQDIRFVYALDEKEATKYCEQLSKKLGTKIHRKVMRHGFMLPNGSYIWPHVTHTWEPIGPQPPSFLAFEAAAWSYQGYLHEEACTRLLAMNLAWNAVENRHERDILRLADRVFQRQWTWFSNHNIPLNMLFNGYTFVSLDFLRREQARPDPAKEPESAEEPELVT